MAAHGPFLLWCKKNLWNKCPETNFSGFLLETYRYNWEQSIYILIITFFFFFSMQLQIKVCIVWEHRDSNQHWDTDLLNDIQAATCRCVSLSLLSLPARERSWFFIRAHLQTENQEARKTKQSRADPNWPTKLSAREGMGSSVTALLHGALFPEKVFFSCFSRNRPFLSYIRTYCFERCSVCSPFIQSRYWSWTRALCSFECLLCQWVSRGQEGAYNHTPHKSVLEEYPKGSSPSITVRWTQHAFHDICELLTSSEKNVDILYSQMHFIWIHQFSPTYCIWWWELWKSDCSECKSSLSLVSWEEILYAFYWLWRELLAVSKNQSQTVSPFGIKTISYTQTNVGMP